MVVEVDQIVTVGHPTQLASMVVDETRVYGAMDLDGSLILGLNTTPDYSLLVLWTNNSFSYWTWGWTIYLYSN